MKLYPPSIPIPAAYLPPWTPQLSETSEWPSSRESDIGAVGSVFWLLVGVKEKRRKTRVILVITNHKNPWPQRVKPSRLHVMWPGYPGFSSLLLYSSLQSKPVSPTAPIPDSREDGCSEVSLSVLLFTHPAHPSLSL